MTFLKPLSPALIRVLFILVLGGIGYGTYQYLGLIDEKLAVQLEATELRGRLGQLQNENIKLLYQLADVQEEKKTLATKVGDIATTVGTLQKLHSIDPELLKKYSKVYFLNENYIPASLTGIDGQYLYTPTKLEQIQTNILPHLQSLLIAAKSQNVTLQVVSGYRSFASQATLKSIYKTQYGSGANKFSADQGYSEHQLGAAIDFTTPDSLPTTLAFEKTAAYTWLLNNAHRYGFILSYPKDNTYYQFEPWHWRYVGVELATRLHDNNQHFYDLDQREIDSYLIKLFD